MNKHSRNCPNCAAPYDPLLNRCPYCGTAYFDMSTINFDSHEPFYLKIRANGFYITQLVVPTAGSMTVESEWNEYCGGLGNMPLWSAVTKQTLTTDLSFTAIANDKTLAVCEKAGD